MSTTAPIEWRYDATSSRLLRLVAHGFVAGLGGALLLVGGSLVVVLPGLLPTLDVGTLLLVALLVLVGGPFSLLYLWPMLTDAAQRPEPTAFAERSPWTPRSVAVAAVAGAVLLWGLLRVGVPFDTVYALVVLAVFSPVLVNLLSTEGTVDGDRLACNGTDVSLAQVRNVRSLRAGNAVVYWVSYARGTGLLAPRLVTVPVETAGAVGAALERGRSQPHEREEREPDRIVQAVVVATGLSFLGVAAVAARAVDDPVVGLYVAGVLGTIGVLLCVGGWRGV